LRPSGPGGPRAPGDPRRLLRSPNK
jgi:hypothetical protein